MALKLLRQLGPGLIFAATAVGTSHLVQTTRGSASYGLSFALPIILICAVKYPAFHAGVEYASRTGRNLVDGYARIGRWLLILLMLAFLFEGVPAITGISLVTAGILKNALGLGLSDTVTTLLVILGCATVLLLGKYHVLEGLTRFFVVLFSGLILVTAVLSASGLGELSGPVAAAIPINRENFLFLVAMTGWMPVGMAAAPMLSAWICARAAGDDGRVRPDEAHFDFAVGYLGTVLLALCFVIVGTAVLFSRDIEVASSSAGFAGQLTGLFASTVGPAMRPVVSLCALVVMLSTALGATDGFTRLLAAVASHLTGRTDQSSRDTYYSRFLLFELALATLLLVFLLRSFLTFIDIATVTAFVTAPLIAAANHRIIFAADAPPERSLPGWFRLWSALAVAILSLVSLAFLLLRFVY